MKRFDIIIIGAGSTGLVIAKLLEKAGFQVVIVEKRPERGIHSRAIGIHPPGLKILQELQILSEFLAKGISVTRGIAHVGPQRIGTITLASDIKPYDRILTIPQYQTEEILEKSLQSTQVLRGWTLKEMKKIDTGAHVEIESDNQTQELACSVLIGADGMQSTVRNLLGIEWSEKTYPFKYAMADVLDNTNFGNDVAVFLSKDGLTESFPLPGGLRRWVVNHDDLNFDETMFFQCINQRTGLHPDASSLSMFSEFEIHQHRAQKIYAGNTFLVGDSVGVMSPIGGQAMSLHWVQAKELVDFLLKFRDRLEFGLKDIPFEELEKIQHKQLARLQSYSKRSHFNTIMGLPGTPNWVLKTISKVLLSPGIKRYWSRRFSMRDLK